MMKKLLRLAGLAGKMDDGDDLGKVSPGSDVEGGGSAKRRLLLPSRGSSKRLAGGGGDAAGNPVERAHLSVWPVTNYEAFAALLASDPSLAGARYGLNDDTLLHRAAKYGRTRHLEAVLALGPDLDAKNCCGQTPLHVAALTLREDIVKLLLDAGADVDLGDNEGNAPIHIACQTGSMAILKMILDRSLCKYGCEGKLGNSLLHYAARYGHLEMMQYLIDQENDVNARNHLTETPVHLASGVHKPALGSKALELLVENGADLHARTDFGDTAAHYAALGGNTSNLEFLIAKGVSTTKPDRDRASEAADRLCDRHGLPDETRKEMKMTFLQKVATSTCINKSAFVIDRLMEARLIMASNQQIRDGGTQIRIFQELSPSQREFKAMADELHADMTSPDSALRIFLNSSPDCVEYLLNKCVLAFCKDQIQGQVFFDFFLFFPPNDCNDSRRVGELALMETLIESRKERFLTHPVFETFLKLKWYKTWKLYLVILAAYALFVVSLVGYSLVHFGNVLEGGPLDPSKVDCWWWFLALTNVYVALVEILKVYYFTTRCFKNPGEQWKRLKKDASLAVSIAVSKSKDVLIPALTMVVLSVDMDPEVRRCVAAVAVILSCLSFMLALSRLPKIGIYIFMLNKVFSTIFNFFITYFWHFFGYAVAFHIIMPKDDEENRTFHSLGDSVIKVLTMLMGEYDYADNFANAGASWVSKAIFVIFVVDMSVVLMNLVLGLAVNDVDSILRDSKVRSMVSETLTVTYLEELCLNFSRLPLVGDRFRDTRIVNSNTCQFREIVYLNLVDVVNNQGNELVIDRSPAGGDRKSHPCPASVMQNIVAILKERKPTISSRPDRKTQTIIGELKSQNVQLQEKIGRMEGQLSTLIDLVNDLHSQIVVPAAEKELGDRIRGSAPSLQP